jgi:hypothetical protein
MTEDLGVWAAEDWAAEDCVLTLARAAPVAGCDAAIELPGRPLVAG